MPILYIIPDPINGNDVVYENSIDPTNPDHIHAYLKLSNQQYWHLIIVDSASSVHNFFELPNQYGLKKTIDRIQESVKGHDQKNFLSAKAEYEDNYSIDDLLRI